jgi:lysophospholipase L1-like esterase
MEGVLMPPSISLPDGFLYLGISIPSRYSPRQEAVPPLLWYDAMALTGQSHLSPLVGATLPDLSGNGIDMAPGTGTGGGGAPVYVEGAINGRPAVLFSATQSLRTAGDVPLGGATALSIYVVALSQSAGGVVVQSSTGMGPSNPGSVQIYREPSTAGAGLANRVELSMWHASIGYGAHYSSAGTMTTSTPRLLTSIIDMARTHVYVPTLALDCLDEPKDNTSTYGVGGASDFIGKTFSDYPWYLGCHAANNASNLKGYIGEVIVFPEANDAAVRRRVENYLVGKWGITPQQVFGTLLFDGDSDFQGTSGPNSNPRPMPLQVAALLRAAGTPVNWINYGTNGERIGTGSDGHLRQKAPSKIDAHLAGRVPVALVARMGINDYQIPLGEGVSGAVAAARYQSYCQERIAAGWPVERIIGMTPHAIAKTSQTQPQIDATESARLAFNAAARLRTAADYGTLVDTGADPAFDSPQDAVDNLLGYYSADKGHLVNAGYAVWADLTVAALDGLGLIS